ncbi:MAG: YtxH domain-containing protein [Candidatus Dojkabacteria bacterium]|jgi:gas vesicle protein|nr:YtxH domain-containing protein [Candidatus Dojkabacteria bacterium]
MSSSEDFFKGLLFGTAVGLTAGILLAPKAGSETREDIKRFAQERVDSAEDYYKKARRQVNRKIKEVKEAGKNIDIDGYKKLVAKVVDEIKRDGALTADVAKQIGTKLNEDWNDIKSSVL